MIIERADMDKLVAAAADALAKKLVDDGKLIEAGWAIFQGLTVPREASDVQRREMRLAFMAGAQHLFASIMNVLDPGEEPTDRDMRRLDSIHAELHKVREELELRYKRPEGTA